jgi:Uma2 family endonuclease
MIVQANKKEYYTLNEYFELEINSQERHEYIDGEIILMTGGTPNHNRIALNFSAAFNLAVKQQSYETFVAVQKLWIPKKRINTYPDVIVVEGEIQLQEGRRDTITNSFDDC